MNEVFQRVLRLTPWVAAMALVATMFAACGGLEDVTDYIEVENVELQRDHAGAPVVSGRIKSTRESPISTAQVQVSLFGPANQKVGEASLTVQDLQPNEWVEFEEVVEADQRVQGARVRSVIVLN